MIEPRRIVFFGTHIGAWADISEAPKMLPLLRGVLGRLVGRGFSVVRDPDTVRDYPRIAHSYYAGQKDELEFHAEAIGRTIAFDFHPTGGRRYRSCKFLDMSPMMQRRCAIEMNHVLQKLRECGYPLDARISGPLSVLRHAQGRTDEGNPLARFNQQWNFESDWKCGGRWERDASGWPTVASVCCEPPLDRDRLPLVSGEFMYCRHRGRLFRGAARPGPNGRWLLESNGEAVSMSTNEMFRCDPSAEPRRLVPGQLRRLHLEAEKALKANAYKRVAVLADAAARIQVEAA